MKTLGRAVLHFAASATAALALPGCDSPALERLRTGREPWDERSAMRVVGGDAQRGRLGLREHSCTSCHAVPGERGPRAQVGPPLTQFGRRTNIGGSLPNHPEQLVRFIMNAPRELPGTGMPDLPVNEAEARDMAAYLYTLR